MNLSQYVRQIGVEAFSRRFRVSRRTALSYLYGQRKPRVPLARRIAARSELSLDDIYRAHTKD